MRSNKVRPTIPMFEPAVIAAAAKKHWRGDDEKVATTSIRDLVIHGVEISSRYSNADELEVMAQIIERTEPAMRQRIKGVYSNSKVRWTLDVDLHHWKPGPAAAVGNFVAEEMRRLVGCGLITVSSYRTGYAHAVEIQISPDGETITW
jgi:hypothetical protein